MKTEKKNIVKEDGGYRAKASEYNEVIDNYVKKMDLIKESNCKRLGIC
ncbi:MAG TPA: hypothetical protein VF691_12550 [Cytophagaceae bacterium]|jgi:hypothetical protein